ncbi:MAG TPA: VOC family protein [Thermoanaerobaculia bacterium]|nr:VOC family protein [Thermoanaerobaculia bacterium]
MAHRSRLTALLFDSREDAYEPAIAFWSAALGREVQPRESPDSKYTYLSRDPRLPIDLMVQRVPRSESGLHVDIETDDVDAEVGRLDRLGARRKRQVKSWWVMEDPAGHAFCVVPVQRKEDWPQGTVEWKG